MRKLFTGDIRRITSNIISIIILIGLVVIPALFTWFNVTASWDPFDNTKNLKFAVASVDEGYSSDLMPVKMKLGDQVIGQLRANSQLDWTFTTKDKAIEGTKAGTYYAAVIIPKDFSRNMMTFFSSDAKHATLEYYTNEKKNAVAPKVTGQGADQISKEVNEMFARTITSTALSVANGLSKQLDSSDARERLTTFNGNINDLASQLNDSATNVDAYASLIDVSETLLSSSSTLLNNASNDAGKSLKQLNKAGGSVKNVSGALDTATSALSQALNASSAGNGAIAADIGNAFDSAGKSSADVSATIRKQAGLIGDQAAQYQKIRDSLASISGVPSDTLTILDNIITQQKALQTALNTSANDLDAKTGDAAGQHEQIVGLANQSKTAIDGLNTNLSKTLKPQIASITSSLSSVSGALGSGGTDLNNSVTALNATANQASSKLKQARATLSDTSTTLSDASGKLTTFSQQLTEALNSGDMAKVKKLLSGDPDKLAATLAAPVALKRNAVFPVENFGTSLTPFYTFIPLWVGSLLIALTIKTNVSRETRRKLGEIGSGAGWSWIRKRRRQRNRKSTNQAKATGDITAINSASTAPISDIVAGSSARTGNDSATASTSARTAAASDYEDTPVFDSPIATTGIDGTATQRTDFFKANANAHPDANSAAKIISPDSKSVPVDDADNNDTQHIATGETAAEQSALPDNESVPIDDAGRLFDEPKPYQLFLGRFGIFAFISLLQSTFSCAGTLLFLRVHAVHPMLFMLAGWVSGLVYAFVIYTLVACFGTIGKALTVIVLVMQISGSSGTYPLQVLPKFVQIINPFLPATHSIQAARAAIAGIYQGDFWIQMGIVLIYAAVMLVIGLIMPKPSKFNTWFSGQMERTKLI
ncbi:YhgE/Pip domain-containing protein [Bifidobacterium sp. ESL0728]|uniref:YhgE/Pip family protein n=1 Tax=Bifidobacterium sp. ESL0728 TaxID=2983220 RepID=UPI0023F69375|nr:YhgE/Pip domain-containing protein [Bifidobacterium sp. ESL0728]WEV59129.1 YhgE/Pip domain-containing protein [Bifidobacterium sp. ESL0728]